MHHFHPFSSSFASAAIVHFHTSCPSPPRAHAAMAPPVSYQQHRQDTAHLEGCSSAWLWNCTPAPGPCQPHRCPRADTQVWRAVSQHKPNAGGQARARGSAPRARLQAAGAAKATLPSKPSLLLPPSMTVGGKMHSSEESKFEQLSSNERFLPPRGCFIKLFVFFSWRWAKQQWKTQEIFQIKTSA